MLFIVTGLLLILLVLFATNIVLHLYYKQKLTALAKEADDQKYAMAEANLKLLEQSEKLEEQKYAMADANLNLLEAKEIIEAEKARSEKLLLNILPHKIADELKEYGKTEPECYENVTVLFSDIVGFTEISGCMEPSLLIAELNDIFTEFDRIIRKNSCERIKTIGDAYLCVCGIPEASEAHAFNVLTSAVEMMRYIKARNERFEMKWPIRIGVHSGKVVAGVVGVEKYIYDVFGDTINTTSRMESNSEPMKINVSSQTYELTRDKFSFIERGEMHVKGKGPVRMYFLEY